MSPSDLRGWDASAMAMKLETTAAAELAVADSGENAATISRVAAWKKER